MKQLFLLLIQIILTLSKTVLVYKSNYHKAALESIKLAVKAENSKFYHSSYNRLAFIVDTYGPRLWGSKAEAQAIDELFHQIEELQFDKYYKQPIEGINTWKRGNEWLTLYSPRPDPQKLSVIGLGLSVPGDIQAEVVVVQSYEQLETFNVKGKIVCFNVPWQEYDVNVEYRLDGPSKASKYGAIGTLIRSVTPFSIDSPHTGVTEYDPAYPAIPAAAITIEDAEMFQRMQDRGQKIEVNLHLESEWYKSRTDNIIAEITGSEKPEEIILFGGHIDSWDNGSQTGALDDGGGVIVCLEVLRVLKELGLRPKRTLRFIVWSGEEMNLPDKGAIQYAKKYANEKHILAFENDEGNSKPYGFGFTGGENAMKMVKQLAEKYLIDINCTVITNDGFMLDTEPLYEQGIPVMKNLVSEVDQYYYFHHSGGDSMTVINADDMDDNVIAIASILFLIADAEQTLPRN